MVEGTIGEWRVPEGALIQKGDAIMEYENEKNTIEYESVHGGYLHILEPAGETVEVGKPIAWVAETKEEYDALTGGAAPAPQAEVPTQQTAQAAAISAPNLRGGVMSGPRALPGRWPGRPESTWQRFPPAAVPTGGVLPPGM